MVGVVLTTVAAIFATACGDARPCDTCPDMSDAWQVTSGAPDGGCALAVPAEPLLIEQAGSALRAEWGALALNGTLYDSYDFTLRTRPGAEPSLNLRGRYVPAAGAIAERLTGTLQNGAPGSASGDGGTGCGNDAPFTASR